MTPSLGRIVLYTNLGDREGKLSAQAAIITGVRKLTHEQIECMGPIPEGMGVREEHGYVIDLHVFYNGQFDCNGNSLEGATFAVPFGDGAEPGSEAARGKWVWPPRV